MNLPVKITPDRIRDSIIQIFFTSEIPFDAQVGIFYTVFEKNGWKYTNRHSSHDAPKGLIVEISPTQQYFFIKDNVRIQLFQNNSIAFNCIGSYPGWAKYQSYILDAVGILVTEASLKQFTRIGIRYISEFIGIDILDHIRLISKFEGVTGVLNTSTFRFIFQESSISKNIQVTSKLPVNVQQALGTQSNSTTFTSLLDIDIVEKGLSISSLEVLSESIEKLHNLEKATFFGILKPEFLQSLNPEYS